MKKRYLLFLCDNVEEIPGRVIIHCINDAICISYKSVSIRFIQSGINYPDVNIRVVSLQFLFSRDNLLSADISVIVQYLPVKIGLIYDILVNYSKITYPGDSKIDRNR